MKKILVIIALVVIVFAALVQMKVIPSSLVNKYIHWGTASKSSIPLLTTDKQAIYSEESVVTKVVEDSLPSVVTIGISKTTQTRDQLQVNPLNPFGPLNRIPGQTQKVEQNIGSGFIVSADGLIISNKHVVADATAGYQVLTNDGKKYEVEKIYRDPLNDLSILKINATGLKPLSLADSSGLKLGQIAIAIGTPLGTFTNTVTAGIVSGLGRGITAGSPFEGSVEKLDNVIQTDAAISPGNSGGPLLNSAGQVMGVNTAVSQQGQNIGFAIPSNVIRDLLTNFQNTGGSFERPYIGIRYQMVDKQTAILNKVVEGAYVTDVIAGSPAEKAGLQVEDIIVEIDGKSITAIDDQALTKAVVQKKIGDKMIIKYYRSGDTKSIDLLLEAFKQ